MIDLATIQPIDNGKYSPYFHQWLQRNKNHPHRFSHVFEMHNRIDGNAFNPHWSTSCIIIGHGEFNPDGSIEGIGGCRLSEILHGKKTPQSWWFTKAFGLRDITEQFWETYQRIGRCAWDHDHGRHMIGDQHRFEKTGENTETCTWCGREFELTTRVVIDRREYTSRIDARSSVPATAIWPYGSMGEAA